MYMLRPAVSEVNDRKPAINAYIESGLTQFELARLMGIKRQDVTHSFNLHHSTKTDAVQKALFALGERLELTAV